jgi:hypothetical protein
MRINTSLQFFIPYIQREINKLAEELGRTLDFERFEAGAMKLMSQVSACWVTSILEDMMTDPTFLVKLKYLGGKLGMRFKARG